MQATRLFTVILVSFLVSATSDSLTAQTITHVPLYTFHGDSGGDGFGGSVSGAGDVNGDGFDDLVVGASSDDNNGSGSGSARVLSGSDGSVLYTFDGNNSEDYFGASVSDAGDVNGDGFADLIIGAPQKSNLALFGASARVLSGIDGSVLYTFNGDTLSNGEGANDRFGRSVSGAGDVNGDGTPDLIVGVPSDDNNGAFSGTARVLSGSDGSVLYNFVGDSVGDLFGWSVSSAGDVNGDGFDDLIVGAPEDDNNGYLSGSARVLSGSDGSVLYTFDGDSEWQRFGSSVSGAGDVNGDGTPDLIVGAPSSPYNDNGFSDTTPGYARVFSGSDGSVLHTLNGSVLGEDFGGSVSSAGDVNGDGMADLIVGASSGLFDFSQNLFLRSTNGRARVLSGSDGSVLHTFRGDSDGDRFGGSVSGAGDVNGDGIDDFIVGARGGGANGGGYARVFVSQISPPVCTLGDVDLSGTVDFLDIQPFIAVLSGGTNQCEADCDQSGMVDFLDIQPFIAILSSQ